MGKLMQAPHTRLEFPLQAGENLTFRAEMALGSSIAHGIWFGCQPPQTIDLLQQAVDHARAADSVVLVIGETADAGLESIDRDATALPAHQVALIRAVCAANPRTVVLLNVAHPVDTGCLADAAAVMVVWYPGQSLARRWPRCWPGIVSLAVACRSPSPSAWTTIRYAV